ncbi:HtaA domain-containing protein [Arthrobacter sp. SAFR-044]|uniref:HtaA domain-containing protein n=1 Tax=Arthrobacter sp. SAFR-044 TaxID=3387278 RepID=UPI003F7BB13A
MNTTTETGLAGRLAWSMKQSFLRYVARLSDGRCSATDGAEPSETEGFTFEVSAMQATNHGLSLAFRGDLRFSGHHGALFLRIADPAILVDGPHGTLSIAGGDADAPRVPLATFTAAVDSSGPALRIAGTGLMLTEAGSELFIGIYPPGEPLDDFTVEAAHHAPASTAAEPALSH